MSSSDPTPADATALKRLVRDKYAAVASGEALSCCGPTGCSDEINMIGDAYDAVDGYVADADLKLGCGLPVEHAGLMAGQTVLDLGAGAGLDAFVARRVVGETGLVLGVDFTPEMVERARANAAALGYTNVRFEHGDIERLPFGAASVDVVVSNCVLNLVPDKAQAFAEMARVLRPGGHFCISDVVSRGALPEAVRASAELYAGCVAGALDEVEYLRLLAAAGFEGVEVVAERPIALPDGLLPDGLLPDSLLSGGVAAPLYSVTVRGVRPASPSPTAPPAEHAALPALHVYEPAMCCSTGLCGPDPDAALVQFAADLKALAAEGASVHRYNLGQTPSAFADEPLVTDAITREGMDVLPLVVRGGEVVSKGRYPSRGELASLMGLGTAQAVTASATDASPHALFGLAAMPFTLVAAPADSGSCCGASSDGGSSCC